jgi:hypothetical protein
VRLWRRFLLWAGIATQADVDALRARDLAAIAGLRQELRGQPFGVCIHDEPPGWNDGDRANFRAFMQTETGKRLRDTINFYEQGGNRRAVLSGDSRQANKAAGFHEFGAWLVELSADVRPQQDDYSQLPQGARETAERFAP